MDVTVNRALGLRRVLRGNAVFSSVSALVVLAASRPLASLMGLSDFIGLTNRRPVAAHVRRSAPLECATGRGRSPPSVDRVGLDLGLVGFSAARLVAGVFWRAGSWLIAGVAD